MQLAAVGSSCRDQAISATINIVGVALKQLDLWPALWTARVQAAALHCAASAAKLARMLAPRPGDEVWALAACCPNSLLCNRLAELLAMPSHTVLPAAVAPKHR